MKKISNFHTHTELCHHATGTPVEYIRQAVKEGCLSLGFSDHCPYPETFFDYWPDIRMNVNQVPLYLNWIEEARNVADFPVYTAYECEWEPEIHDWYDELKSTYKADYLVLGSHWFTEGKSHIYVLDADSKPQMNKYIDQTIDGMQSKKFAFIAHPDIFMAKFQEWNEDTRAWSKALIEASIDLSLPLEINGLGMSRRVSMTSGGVRYAYPYYEFWELAASMGVKNVYCNADAHCAEDVIFSAWRARDFASRFNFNVLESC